MDFCCVSTHGTSGSCYSLTSSSTWGAVFTPRKHTKSLHFHVRKEKNKGGIDVGVHEKLTVKDCVGQRAQSPHTKKVSRDTSKTRTKSTEQVHKSADVEREIANSKRAFRRTMSAILRMEAAKAGVERKAATKKATNLFPKAVLEALNDRMYNKQWQSALQIFGLLREQQWYQPKIEIYLKLLVMLGRCRQHEKAYILFQMMLEEGCAITVEVYTALLAAYGRSGVLDNAFAILDEMKAIPHCQPNIFTYTILIKSCVELGHFEYVDRLLAEISSAGMRPNIVTYNTIVDGYGKAGMLEEMENILSHMFENHNCKPDVWTMNSTIRAFGNKGQIENMEKWYEKFYSIGLQPDARTFNIIISSYGKQCLYDKMTRVMENMQKCYFSWTTVTYNTVIDAYGRVGEIEKMEYFYNLMISEGVKPNSITLCTLVSAYSKGGMFHKITKFLRQLENSDIVPDTPFFNSVIDAYRREGNLTEMEKVFQQMKDRRCEPDEITFGTMFMAYSSEGMFEKVEMLKKKMQNMLRTKH